MLSQAGQPLFVEDMPEPMRVPHKERSNDRAPRSGGQRRGFASYRVEVGKRHHVEPRQIVGALANEGGLSREDFGKIDIKPAFSIVELPVDLDPAVLDKLSGTRISGVLINIKPDKFDRGHKRGHTGPTGSPNKKWSATGGSSYSGEKKKPRHKSG